jgi:hypothetical protein
MKFLKNVFLVLGLLFFIAFIYSLFDKRDSSELFFWDVNIWIYRGYRLLIAIILMKLYLNQKSLKSKKGLFNKQ